MEIGGYIEFPSFTGSILHNEALALNSARNCLAYLIEARGIKKIVLPKFLCASVEQICKQYNVSVNHYSIGKDFLPHNLYLDDEQWLYLVNYYGQIDNDKIKQLQNQYKKIIVDNVQAYFQIPLKNVDTIYTCRKYFGVPDGAFLYSNACISRILERDKSSNRMRHLLGRYEGTGNDFYSDYTQNEAMFETLPLRYMSKLTSNILQGIDYLYVKTVRENNFHYLHEKLSPINQLNLSIPAGPFMYPLYIANGNKLRKQLQEKNIYIPTLWPDVFTICDAIEIEYDFAQNILPLPCDQRYSLVEMELMVNTILDLI